MYRASARYMPYEMLGFKKLMFLACEIPDIRFDIIRRKTFDLPFSRNILNSRLRKHLTVKLAKYVWF